MRPVPVEAAPKRGCNDESRHQRSGIAGGTLAYWLLCAGHEPILIEHAPALRTGGYIMDFWGVGYTIAERMGILAAVRNAGYQVEEIRFLDDQGHKVGGFGVDAMRSLTHGRITSVARSALAAEIYRSLEGRVETIFDDQISAIEEHDAGVRITLQSGGQRNVDSSSEPTGCTPGCAS